MLCRYRNSKVIRLYMKITQLNRFTTINQIHNPCHRNSYHSRYKCHSYFVSPWKCNLCNINRTIICHKFKKKERQKNYQLGGRGSLNGEEEIQSFKTFCSKHKRCRFIFFFRSRKKIQCEMKV